MQQKAKENSQRLPINLNLIEPFFMTFIMLKDSKTMYKSLNYVKSKKNKKI